nr:hypothetical protein [Tanacetum cinerariifolium]
MDYDRETIVQIQKFGRVTQEIIDRIMQNVLPKPDLIGELGKIKEVIEELETKLQVPEHPVNLGVPKDQIIAPQKQRRKGRQIKPVDGYSWVRYHQYIPLDKSKPKKYYFKCKYHKVCKGKAKIIEPANSQAFIKYTFEHSWGGGHGDHDEVVGQGVPGEGVGQGVPSEGDFVDEIFNFKECYRSCGQQHV